MTKKLQSTLHLFDLIVGTEEEFHIAGGSTDTIAALRAVRAVSHATLVCKRGAKGAVAFKGAIPDTLDDGQTGPGFPIEVFNVLAPVTASFPDCSRAGSRTRTGRPRSNTPTPAAPSPCRATDARRPIRRWRSSSSFFTRHCSARLAARPGARADPLVDEPSRGLVRDAGLRL